MPKRRKNLVMEKYKVYLGSAAGRSYQESVDFCKGISRSIATAGSYHYEVFKEELSIIDSGVGNPFACMEHIGERYKAQASVDLVVHGDVQAFKQHAYVAAKLQILSEKEPDWGYSGYSSMYFLHLLSDNPELKEFLISQQDTISGSLEQQTYKGYGIRPYLNRSALLALSGGWEHLKERSLRFLNDTKRPKNIAHREPDFKFFLALANQDTEEMKRILEGELEYWLSTRAKQDMNVHFDFYLCIPVLIYAKIAAIHGFDLGIDSPIAPKELIEVKPLESYEDPYDFMKEFDYKQPQQVWIDRWKAKMEAGLAWREREYKKLKNRILRFFGRGGRLIDLQPSSPIDKQ